LRLAERDAAYAAAQVEDALETEGLGL
jgi:hypothetical protein